MHRNETRVPRQRPPGVRPAAAAMNNGGIAWWARNPVASNLVMAFLIVSGFLAATTVQEEI